MIDEAVAEVMKNVSPKDLMVIVGAAISTYFVAREANRKAAAANRRLDELLNPKSGTPGILVRLAVIEAAKEERADLPEKVTRLEEGRKTDRVELLRVRDNAHFAIGTIGAVVGFTANALDIVEGAVGHSIPRPKLVLPKRPGDDEVPEA